MEYLKTLKNRVIAVIARDRVIGNPQDRPESPGIAGSDECDQWNTMPPE